MSLKYRWFADGVAIKKATRSTLVLTAKQVGEKDQGQKVTAAARGYTPLTVTTKRTRQVKRAP